MTNFNFIILNNLIFLPEIYLIFIICFFILFLTLILKNNFQKNILNYSCFFTNLILICYLILIYQNLTSFGFGFNFNLITNEGLNYCKIIIILLIIFLNYLSIQNLKLNQIYFFEFYFLILILIFASLIIINSYNFLTLIFAIELQSITLYIIISLKNNSILNIESVLKYFLIGSLTAMLSLISIFFFLINFNTLNFIELNNLTNNTNNLILILNFILFLSIIFYKLGISPFNNWVPDIYQTSLTSIILFISTISKIVIIVCLINILNLNLFYNLIFLNFNIFLILPFLIVTLILGAIKGLTQNNLKRILAYSSFIHLSFILLALFFLPLILTNNVNFYSKNYQYFIFDELKNFNFSIELKIKIAVFTIVFFYLFVYVLLNLLFFSFLIIFTKITYNLKFKELKTIADLINIDTTNKLVSFFIVSIMLSLIGLPPFAGFFAKYLILYQIFISNYKFLSLIFLFFSLISSFYYFKVIKMLYFTKKKNLSTKFSNLIYLNSTKYYLNYNFKNKIILFFLILINLVLNYGCPFYFFFLIRLILKIILKIIILI